MTHTIHAGSAPRALTSPALPALAHLLRLMVLASLTLAVVTGALPSQAPSAAAQTAAPGLPPLPAGWPATLQLGMTDQPGGASALRASAPFGFRYQYLAGGVNTGSGWATWNADGNFVTYYVRDSVESGIIPVFTYYMIYQSSPGGGDESGAVLANLQNATTMAAYFGDLKLFFQRAGAFSQMVVLHVEPDMWGFIQQRASGDDAATVPVQVASAGLPELAGLPDTAAGLAQAVKRLRDAYAPNVVLGYHVSIWGTRVDIQHSQTDDATTDALATRAGAFYHSLRTDFDLAFAEFSDRDAAYKQYVSGDGGRSWFDADDFRRHARFLRKFAEVVYKRLVLWQIPLGNTRMRAQNNTPNHYQDNRVETLLDDPARAWLAQYANAGAVAFLFGRGASGNTSASEAAGDGVTNPSAINGNTLESLSADDDGGFFRWKAKDYYAAGTMPLPASGGTFLAPTATPMAATGTGTTTGTPSSPTATATPSSPTATATPAPQASFTTSASVSPGTVPAGGTAAISAAVTGATTATVLVDIEVYDAVGIKVFQRYFDSQALAAGQTGSYPVSWSVPATAAGTYTVKVGVFSPGWASVLHWNDAAAAFSVEAATGTPIATSTPTATATASLPGDATATGTATVSPPATGTPTPVTTPASSAPSAPGGLAARAVSRSQVDLAWTDTSGMEAGFRVERSTDGKAFAEIAVLGANATAYADAGLSPNTTYHYRVRAHNAAGASPSSNTASARTLRR